VALASTLVLGALSASSRHLLHVLGLRPKRREHLSHGHIIHNPRIHYPQLHKWLSNLGLVQITIFHGDGLHIVNCVRHSRELQTFQWQWLKNARLQHNASRLVRREAVWPKLAVTNCEAGCESVLAVCSGSSQIVIFESSSVRPHRSRLTQHPRSSALDRAASPPPPVDMGNPRQTRSVVALAEIAPLPDAKDHGCGCVYIPTTRSHGTETATHRMIWRFAGTFQSLLTLVKTRQFKYSPPMSRGNLSPYFLVSRVSPLSIERATVPGYY